jgi:Flp pilus assembly pilin Flp
MTPALDALHAVARDESGATLAEYALITASLGVLMIGALKLIQSETGAQLTATGGGLTAVGVTPP